METVVSWIDLATSLNQKQGKDSKEMEDGFKKLESTIQHVSEARELVENLLSKNSVSQEETLHAMVYYQNIAKKLKKNQILLLRLAINSCIVNLKSLLHMKSISEDFVAIASEVKEKIKESKLEDSFGRCFPKIFRKLQSLTDKMISNSN